MLCFLHECLQAELEECSQAVVEFTITRGLLIQCMTYRACVLSLQYLQNGRICLQC